MATCKECIHYDLCRSCTRIQLGWHGNSVHYVENIEEICKDFKDCSQFVELPCNIGNFVYFIQAHHVMADIVSKFTIDRCGVMLQRVNGYNLGYTDQLGKKIFLTREEAEQALKDREKND